jgi:predicted component of type VI protein secretion system
MDATQAHYEAPDHRSGPGALEMPVGFVPLKLVLVPGGLSVELLRPDMLMGRHSEADIRLALPDVSRRHCRFTFQNGFWKVFDLNSMNGVWVNGERMHEATLYDGDQMRIGGFTFLIRLENQPGVVPLPNRTAANQNEMIKSIADVLPRADEQRKAS